MQTTNPHLSQAQWKLKRVVSQTSHISLTFCTTFFHTIFLSGIKRIKTLGIIYKK